MTAALAVHQFPATGQTVRTVVIDGEPWFVARDVCAVLAIANSRMAVSRLDGDGVSTTDVIDSMGRTQRAAIVNEGGLYELIFLSRKPEARAFRRWVTHEVLPAIRKTGRYEATPAPDITQLDRRALAVMVIEAEDARIAAEQRAAELEPRARSWDVLASGRGDYSVADAAKILSRDPLITTGERRLFAALADLGWLYRAGDGNWRAYQRQVDAGRLSELPRTYAHPRTGETAVAAPQIRITPRGLHDLHRHLGGRAPLQLPLEITHGQAP